MTGEQVRAATAIIKQRFPNLTVDETIDIVTKIIEAIERATPPQTTINRRERDPMS